ncbi:DUF3995 domain-containing protein [Staphylococcus sp. HKU1]|uniref:DUF3995 domain-containing protein n=1 Tax=Staphylococcus sp. HKU1 TaxID=3068989 RepID=UPI003AAC27D0
MFKKVGLYLFLISGSLHSLATFYWAFGGDVGLATVGNWTIEFKQNYGMEFHIVLLLVGLLKITATWSPIILTFKENKPINIISFLGSCFLIIYGGMNTISGWLKLLGVISVDFKLSIIGQSFIWDPLFLLWGIGLLIFLKSNRGIQQ